jgi:phosphohistidine phosphatase
MMLYVVRHAIAEDAAPHGGDGARRLTPEGRRKMERVARGLRALGIMPDVILTSPLVRAVETTRIVVAALRDAPEPRELDALVSDVAATDTLKALRPFSRNRHVMIVGHEPNLSNVVSLLLTGAPGGAAMDLKKGGCAAVELTAFAPHGGATLLWLLPPRVLRRVRR